MKIDETINIAIKSQKDGFIWAISSKGNKRIVANVWGPFPTPSTEEELAEEANSNIKKLENSNWEIVDFLFEED